MNHTAHVTLPGRARGAAPRAGFTLVELLIVMAVIIVLLSLLIVGLNFATKTAQGANTTALMQSINQALVRFQDDVGYLPPVLDNDRPTRQSLAPVGQVNVDHQEISSTNGLSNG